MILVTLTLLSTTILLIAVLNVFRWRSKPVIPVEVENVKISIIKPVRGLEPDLTINLLSFFNLSEKVPFELLFCIKDPMDPALKVIRNLMESHPEVKAKLHVGSPDLGRNPKVSNIHCAWEMADSDLILISDSNVHVPPNYLEELLSERTVNVGLVTQALYGTDAKSVGAHLDAVHLNSFYLKATAFVDMLGFPAVSGKCMLLSKKQFEELGGINAVKNYLAEDLMTSEIMRRAGLQVRMAPALLRQTSVIHTFNDYWNRHTRWARLRKSHFFFAYLLEPIFFETIWPVLLILTATTTFQTYIAWECLALQWMGNVALYGFKFKDAGTWKSFKWFLVKDLVAPFIWLGGLLSNKVMWRGNQLYLRFGGKLGSKYAWAAQWRLLWMKLPTPFAWSRWQNKELPIFNR
jgi:ceramide glucosyltransferase